jgi:hypothetical protein
VVFIPKYRKKAIFGVIKKRLGEVFHELARRRESKIEEGHLMSDHVKGVRCRPLRRLTFNHGGRRLKASRGRNRGPERRRCWGARIYGDLSKSRTTGEGRPPSMSPRGIAADAFRYAETGSDGSAETGLAARSVRAAHIDACAQAPMKAIVGEEAAERRRITAMLMTYRSRRAWW